MVVLLTTPVGIKVLDGSLLRAGIMTDYNCFATTCNSVYSPTADQTVFTDPMDLETFATVWHNITNTDRTVSEDGISYINVQPTPQMLDGHQLRKLLKLLQPI